MNRLSRLLSLALALALALTPAFAQELKLRILGTTDVHMSLLSYDYYQDKAVETYTVGYTKAIQMQVYNDYTAKIREALGRLAAQKFPPEHEARSKERSGDRPPNPEMVTEVAR